MNKSESSNSKTIDIAYSTSDSYFDCMLVSLYSLLCSKGESDEINVFILGFGISEANIKRLEKLMIRYDTAWSFIECSSKIDSLCLENKLRPVRGSFSTYCRLFIDDLIDCEKVIYIDCDTLVKDSLASLWNIDLGSALMGACPEIAVYAKNSDFEDAFVINQNKVYFNMGITLINLSLWRKESVSLAISTLLRESTFSFRHDQSIVNYYLNDRIVKIPLKFNFSTTFHKMKYKTYIKYFHGSFIYSYDEFNEAQNHPIIVHYLGAPLDRPWYSCSVALFKREYSSYWKEITKKKKIKWPKNQRVIFALYDRFIYFIKKFFPNPFYIWFRYRFSQFIHKNIVKTKR